MLREILILLSRERKFIYLKLLLSITPPCYFFLHPSQTEIGYLIAIVALTSLILNLITVGAIVALQDSSSEEVRKVIITGISLLSIFASIILLFWDLNNPLKYLIIGSIFSGFLDFARLLRNDLIYRTGGNFSMMAFCILDLFDILAIYQSWIITSLFLFMVFSVRSFPTKFRKRVLFTAVARIRLSWSRNVFRTLSSNLNKRGEGLLLGSVEVEQFVVLRVIRALFSVSQTLSVMMFDLLRITRFSSFSTVHLNQFDLFLKRRAMKSISFSVCLGLVLVATFLSVIILEEILGWFFIPILFICFFCLQQISSPILAFLYQRHSEYLLNVLAIVSLIFFMMMWVWLHFTNSISLSSVIALLYGGSLVAQALTSGLYWFSRGRY